MGCVTTLFAQWCVALRHWFGRDDRWPVNGSLRQPFLLDAEGVDDCTLALHALWRDASCFAVNSVRSVESRVVGGWLVASCFSTAVAHPVPLVQAGGPLESFARNLLRSKSATRRCTSSSRGLSVRFRSAPQGTHRQRQGVAEQRRQHRTRGRVAARQPGRQGQPPRLASGAGMTTGLSWWNSRLQ